MDKKDYRLKGHESFTLREGWLTKGLNAVHENDSGTSVHVLNMTKYFSGLLTLYFAFA